MFKKNKKQTETIKEPKEKKVRTVKVGTHKKAVIALWVVLIASVSFGVYKNFTAIDQHTTHEKEIIELRLQDTNGIENFVKNFAKSYYTWNNSKEAIESRTQAINGYLTKELQDLNVDTIRTDDEFDNGNAFLFSLPITRKDYVLEKYIFGLISGIMFLLLGTVISLVVIGITKTGSFNEIFLTAGSLFPTILLILSIMLPFILKFGGEKGRIAIIGVMGFIFVIGLLLIKTTEYLGIDLYVLINKLPKFEPLVYIILFLLLSVVILGISYLISLTILKKKEF